MTNAISNVAPQQPIHQVTAQPSTPKPTAPPTSTADTVKISTSAKAMLQEMTETSTQTAQEARGGDTQAIRLQAKEAAAKASAK